MPNLQTFERAEYQQVKADLHRKILDRLDLEKLGRTNSETAREEVLILIRTSVNSEAVPSALPSGNAWRVKFSMRSSGWARSSPCLKIPASRIFSSTASTRSTSSAPEARADRTLVQG